MKNKPSTGFLAWVAIIALCAINSRVAHGDDDLTLQHSRWTIHAEPTVDSKKDGALPFDEELLFEKGTLTTPKFQKEGFLTTKYHSGGPETFLHWGCSQSSATSGKITWSGFANREHRGAWKMDGSVTRNFLDGRVNKYKFKGKGEPLPTDPLEAR